MSDQKHIWLVYSENVADGTLMPEITDIFGAFEDWADALNFKHSKIAIAPLEYEHDHHIVISKINYFSKSQLT